MVQSQRPFFLGANLAILHGTHLDGDGHKDYLDVSGTLIGLTTAWTGVTMSPLAIVAATTDEFIQAADGCGTTFIRSVGASR